MERRVGRDQEGRGGKGSEDRERNDQGLCPPNPCYRLAKC